MKAGTEVIENYDLSPLRFLASVRENNEPFLIEAHTYRFRAHSIYDPELYRAKEEVGEMERAVSD